jgi:polyisoprenoid-binding protein YceI
MDPAHSSAHFKVRHMISNVRGEFRVMRGTLTLDPDNIRQSNVAVEIEASSIETRDQQRDADLRSANFFHAERYPLISFQSTKIVRKASDALRIQGDLTIHGITRGVALHLDSVSQATKDPSGNLRLAVSASTSIRRKDFGLTWNVALETGEVLLGDDVTIDLEVQFVKPRHRQSAGEA